MRHGQPNDAFTLLGESQGKLADADTNPPPSIRVTVVDSSSQESSAFVNAWRNCAPYCLAIAFPWSMWLGNWTEEPSPFDGLGTFVGSLAWAMLIGLAARLMLRDAAQRAIAASVLVLAGLGYGHVYQLLNPWGVWHRHLLPAWLLLAGLGVAAAVWKGARRTKFAGWLRNAALIALLLPLVQLARWRSAEVDPVATSSAASQATQPNGLLPSERPDVYYLILDGYAREDVLRQVHRFDNSQFLADLRARGFFVADDAKANYAQTRLALPAALNMDYLPALPPDDPYEPHHTQLRALRKQGRVLTRLREAGYRYRHVGSAHFRRAPDADEEFYLGRDDGGYRAAFLATTLLAPFLEKMTGAAIGNPADVHEYQFATIASPKTSNEPLYTFAHICCPHPPYVYGRDGRLPRPICDDDADSQLYTEQIRYLNGRVLELIDAIDRTCGRQAVIVLQADHGSAMLGMAQEPTAEQLHERLSIFSALRAPPGVQRRLYPGISPVNTFRVVFNGLFDDHWPLLPDESLYSTYERPFQYTRVDAKP